MADQMNQTPPAADAPDLANATSANAALARHADWLARILAITNRLIQTPSDRIDAGIHAALAATGQLAGSDRTYVFRVRPPDRIDNTHEWCADGIEPMIDLLQDMPDSLLDEWRDSFARDTAAYIPDVMALPETSAVREVLAMQGIRSLLAVPMTRDGRITGFVGYDAVRDYRTFLPVEIQLIQSVANAIGVMIERAAAETEAEAARASLRDERDRLQATLTALPDLVLELDADARFVNFNEGNGASVAFDPDLFIGRLPEEFLSPRLAKKLRVMLSQLDTEGTARPLEYDLEIEGARHWYQAQAASLASSSGQRGYVIAVRDITEQQLRRLEVLRLAKVAERTSNLVIVTNEDGLIEWANPAFEQRSGWQLDLVRGRKPASLLVSRDAPQHLRQAINHAFAHGLALQIELPVLNSRDEEYWLSVDIQPLRDDFGTLIGFVLVATDITSLKEAELRAIRERAEAMDISSDGIAICEIDGPYSYMNRAHRAMFGIGPEEDVSQMNWRDLYPVETINRFMKHSFPMLKRNGSWRGELTGFARDGQPIVQEVTLTLKDNGNLLCITRDKSDEIRTANEQARLRDELQIANRRETIAHVTMGVAHDLNNLVAVVAGTATLLEARADSDPELAVGIARIRRATETARDLVAGLGSLGRPTSARGRRDLRALVSDATELLGSNRIQQHGVTVSAPATECPVWASKTDVLQVVVNLALNACESCDRVPPRVSLSLRSPETAALPERAPDVGRVVRDAPMSVLVITDTGAGIAEEARAMLFERYYTTKGQSGTGLGLPIVASILRDNDAALWMDSAPGKGTEVTIAWPAGAATATRNDTASHRRPAVTDLDGHNILVVDDVADVADVFAEMLESAGAAAISVADPAEARELLRDNPGVWSALVTDLHMPGIGGDALAQVAADLTPPVPAILVTALAESIGPSAGLFAAILPKPVDAAHLVAAVETAIRQSQAGQAAQE